MASYPPLSKESIATADRNQKFLDGNWKSIHDTYKGKWIAIAHEELAGTGETAKEAYDAALKKYPNDMPLAYFVPEKGLEC